MREGPNPSHASTHTSAGILNRSKRKQLETYFDKNRLYMETVNGD